MCLFSCLCGGLGSDPLGGSGTGGDGGGVLAVGGKEVVGGRQDGVAAVLAAELHGFGEAEGEEGGVKEGDAECGCGANDCSFGKQVDQQAGSDSDGHGLGGFAAGEGFQVSEQTAEGEAGSGGARGSIHVLQSDADGGVNPWGDTPPAEGECRDMKKGGDAPVGDTASADQDFRPTLELLVTLPGGGVVSLAVSAACLPLIL